MYDGDGKRIKKIQGGTTTLYVYNAFGNLIAEYSDHPSSSGGTTYLTTDHLGSTRVVTDASKQVKSRHDYLPFGDEISSGYGNRNTITGYNAQGGIANLNLKQKFSAKERDTESNLDYFGARYMSGAQGRFMSPDEFVGGPYEVGGSRGDKAGPLPYADIMNPQSLNKFEYALNNPLRYIDPDGHEIALAGTAQDKEEQRRRLLANASRKGESSLFKTVTDRNGKTTLVLDKDKAAQFAGKHSAGYNLLVGAIEAKPTITVQLSNFDAYTSRLDAKGNVTVNLSRTTSPIDSLAPLRGYDGQRITNPFNIIAGHEVLGHAYPKIIGQPSDELTARTIENILRKEQGLPLRDPNSN